MVSRKLKFLIPKDRGELIPIFFTLFLISAYAIFELSVILPTIYHNIFTYKEILHLLFGCYVIFNVIGNLYICMITDTSIDTIICPVLLPSATVTTTDTQQNIIQYYCNWHYCHHCEVNVPPRSQHCYLCKKCILKHDHHCTFLGRCIGFRNIRYYMCFLIWVWVRKLSFEIKGKFCFFRLV
jgi:palmitoyltransferase